MFYSTELKGIANCTDWVLEDKVYSTQEKDLPEVSIVIPYFRRPVTILQTLYSITRLNYDLSKLDIIIVDDGSPIEDRPTLGPLCDILRIRYLFQRDEGYRVSAARNLGIRHALSDYIIILDCDLVVLPEFLNQHLNVLMQSLSLISVGLRDSYSASDELQPSDFSKHSPNDLDLMFGHSDWRLGKVKDENGYISSNACWRLCSGGNLGFHKSLFDKVGGFNELFSFWGGEDNEWAYRAYKKGAYFHIQDKVLAYHVECRNYEFQIQRSADLEKRDILLKNLVPVFNRHEKEPGDIPYVSIFVTNYKKLEYLEECLLSVPKSTSYRFEIVIVNDSECKVSEVVDKLPQDLADKVVVEDNNVHLGAELSFKKAIDLCRGEFIAQLDADDYLLPNAIDMLVHKLNRCDSDIAYSKHKVLKDGILEDGWVSRDSTREMRLLSGMYYHPLRVFRARAIHRVGGMRILGLEGAVDFSLYSQMELACKSIFCNVYTYVYRQVKNSISNTHFSAQIEGVRKVVEDNARLLSTTQDFTITQVKERLYSVKFRDHDAVEYIKHLDLLN